MLRKLFEQAEAQPHFILSFLKLYSAETESSQTLREAAVAVKKRLDAVHSNEATPKFLIAWLNYLFIPHGRSYALARRDPRNPFHKLACDHSYDQWHSYWIKWYSVLRRGWTSTASADDKPIFPEIYKDYQEATMSSKSYDKDFMSLVSMMYLTRDFSPLTDESLKFVVSYLDEDVRDELLTHPAGVSAGMPSLEIESSLLGFAVGEVQHIHKKGGGTELRDIAVPNRFIQAALVPVSRRLYNLVRLLPRDATFDQSKFDTKIQNRVNNSTLYQGSVDLSKATDNLPLNWGTSIVSVLDAAFIPQPWYGILPKVEGKTLPSFKLADYHLDPPEDSECSSLDEEYFKSLKLFLEVSRAHWEDNSYFQQWKVGQPLGSLPSFAMLSITHNLFVESLSASMGYSHSPYVILGDDIVIMNKKVRSRYIRELTSRGIPLSLHKSFEGRLSEFAGKTYVHGSLPFYTSDHNPVTWNSLFDWQRTTGIRIPWEYLPKAIRSKILNLTRRFFCDRELSTSRTLELANSAYSIVQTCEVCGLGSHLYPISDSEEWTKRIEGYFEYRITDDLVPEAVKHSGITLIGNRYPITLMSSRFADKNGHFLRFRPVQLPDWYKAKVRPCTTDAAIAAALAVLSDEMVDDTL
jgi:hypothetical protein